MKFRFFDENPISDLDPNQKLRGFETFDTASDSRKNLVKVLRGRSVDADQLVDILANCRNGTRCLSAACPVCVRRFRMVWCSRIARCVMNNADRWCAASIVPAELALPRGELDRFEVTRAKERLRKQLERSPIKRAAIIGGFDYALQTFDGRAPKWRPHMYLLIEASQGRIEVALKRHYPNDPDTRKAVIIKPLTWGIQSSMKTATYTFKAEFYKRAPGTDVRGNSDPEQMSLSPAERTELALLLHKQGFLGRTIRRGRHADFRELTTR